MILDINQKTELPEETGTLELKISRRHKLMNESVAG